MFGNPHRPRRNDDVDPSAEPIPVAPPASEPTGEQPVRRGTPTGSPAFVARLKAVLDG